MESQYQKWVNISYLAVAVLLGWIVFEFGTKIAGTYDLEARIHHIDDILRGASIVLGAITFAVLYRNDQANQFMNEVVTELARVTWPTQKETTNATIVVIIMVLISSMVLGFLDFVWTKLLQMIL